MGATGLLHLALVPPEPHEVSRRLDFVRSARGLALARVGLPPLARRVAYEVEVRLQLEVAPTQGPSWLLGSGAAPPAMVLGVALWEGEAGRIASGAGEREPTRPPQAASGAGERKPARPPQAARRCMRAVALPARSWPKRWMLALRGLPRALLTGEAGAQETAISHSWVATCFDEGGGAARLLGSGRPVQALVSLTGGGQRVSILASSIVTRTRLGLGARALHSWVGAAAIAWMLAVALAGLGFGVAMGVVGSAIV